MGIHSRKEKADSPSVPSRSRNRVRFLSLRNRPHLTAAHWVPSPPRGETGSDGVITEKHCGRRIPEDEEEENERVRRRGSHNSRLTTWVSVPSFNFH